MEADGEDPENAKNKGFGNECSLQVNTEIQNGQHEPKVVESAEFSQDNAYLMKFLPALTKQQLAAIVMDSAIKHADSFQKAKDAISLSPMTRRLMIRNISFSTDGESFYNLCRSFGEFEDATIVRDYNGFSKGFGFVTFKDLSSVRKMALSNPTLDKRQLIVRLAADPYGNLLAKDSAESSNPKSSSDRNVADNQARKVFVRNLASRTTSSDLKEAFSQFGDVMDCSVITDSEGVSRHFGFVTFKSSEAARLAVASSERVICGQVMFITYAFPRANQRGVLPWKQANYASYTFWDPMKSGQMQLTPYVCIGGYNEPNQQMYQPQLMGRPFGGGYQNCFG